MHLALKFSSSTPFSIEHLDKVYAILNTVTKIHQSYLTIADVNKQIDSAMLQNHIDLTQVRQKIINCKYLTIQSILDDIESILEKYLFGQDSKDSKHIVCNTENTLKITFKNVIRQNFPNIKIQNFKGNVYDYEVSNSLFPNIDTKKSSILLAQNNNSKYFPQIDYESKLNVSKKIMKLSSLSLSSVVEFIKKISNNSFKNISKDRFQIILDNLNPSQFKLINQQIDKLLQIEKENRYT